MCNTLTRNEHSKSIELIPNFNGSFPLKIETNQKCTLIDHRKWVSGRCVSVWLCGNHHDDYCILIIWISNSKSCTKIILYWSVQLLWMKIAFHLKCMVQAEVAFDFIVYNFLHGPVWMYASLFLYVAGACKRIKLFADIPIDIDRNDSEWSRERENMCTSRAHSPSLLVYLLNKSKSSIKYTCTIPKKIPPTDRCKTILLYEAKDLALFPISDCLLSQFCSIESNAWAILIYFRLLFDDALDGANICRKLHGT